ncbi:MAG: hypothetical protein [Caudoviricetes sp.]|nr:MAG: hypothetical protein [Caudoviricetes sp.]
MEKTLLEILLEELPKRGGWPEGVPGCKQFSDGQVCFGTMTSKFDFHPGIMSSDFNSNHWDLSHQVTREQYEQAVK